MSSPTMKMAFSSISEDDDGSGFEFDRISNAKDDKYNLIRQAEKNGSLWELREMALTRGGLVNRE